MLIEWLKILLIVGALVGLLSAVHKLAVRFAWPPEWQRKTLHVALGLTALSFPWLFVDRWSVWTICGVGALILLALRKIPCLRQRLGRTLHDVQRNSTGELLFPVAIALLYGLAAEPVTYAVPLAILTLADTAAALVGLQWGRHPFAIPDGRKSWEGVVAFAVSTIMVTIPLLFWLTALPWPALLLAATVVLLLTTLTEAVAWHGHDNLLVPLAGYLALRLTLAQPVPVLLSQLLIVAGLALLFVPLWQQLPPHTTLTGLLTLTALWLGGPLLWLVALLTLLICHRIAQQSQTAVFMDRLDSMPVHYWQIATG